MNRTIMGWVRHLAAGVALLSMGCVAQVGTDGTEATGSSSAELNLPKPVQGPPGTSDNGGNNGGDPPVTPPSPPPVPIGPPGSGPGGDKNNGEGPVPSPWYGGTTSSSK